MYTALPFTALYRRSYPRASTLAGAIIACYGLLATSCAVSESSSTQGGAPALLLPDGPFDLGSGPPGAELVGYLPLKNAGQQTLHIERIEAGCACAWTKLECQDIPPGQETRLSLAARIRNEGDRRSFALRIVSNDPSSPVSVVVVRAAAGPPLIRCDRDSVQFGELCPGSNPAQRILILRPGGSPWPTSEPVRAESSIGAVSVAVHSLKDPVLGGVVAVEVRPRADLPLGAFEDIVRLHRPGSSRSTNVVVRGNVVPPVVATPSAVYFGDVRPGAGTALSRNIMVRRTNGAPLGRLVRSQSPDATQVQEVKSGVPPTPVRRLVVKLDPRLVRQNAKDEELLLWFEGEAEPVAIRLMIFLTSKKDSENGVADKY